jgi:potassium channel subfamily K, other eukaryote
LSEQRLTKRKEAHAGPGNGKKYLSHAELCLQQHLTLEERAASIKSRTRSKSQSQARDGTAKNTTDDPGGNPSVQEFDSSSDSCTGPVDEQTQTVEYPDDAKESRSANGPTPKETASTIAEEEAMREIDQLLVKRVLQLAVELETQARALLMHTMPKGSRSEVLLRADMVRRVPFGAAFVTDLDIF